MDENTGRQTASNKTILLIVFITFSFKKYPKQFQPMTEQDLLL
ncbi:hypothetical protein KT99_06677 [Shewanella benthica KT99]|uniref:Uncharacterized protein n=1 Tax=Shewanella benthica KT99 TaxID=314608 RepID=A9CVD9_9GAMM|nr:hypothetical protein KT99_06677 [Shewanella benthica KT99]